MSETADIYALFDPRDGRVRYIGKANCAAKRFATHLRDSRRRDTPVYRWIRKLIGLGLLPELKVILTVPQAEWPEHERNIIAFAVERGIKLLNVSPGGDAPTCPTEVRSANGRMSSERMKRQFADPVWRKAWNLNRYIGQQVRNGTLKDSSRAKIRQAAALAPHMFGKWANI